MFIPAAVEHLIRPRHVGRAAPQGPHQANTQSSTGPHRAAALWAFCRINDNESHGLPAAVRPGSWTHQVQCLRGGGSAVPLHPLPGGIGGGSTGSP